MVSLTTDASLISSICNHKRVKKWIADDFSEFKFNDGWLYLEIDKLGIIGVQPMNYICYQFHIALLPELWGRGAEICAEVGRWIFNNTPCQKLVAIVPAYNRLAVKIAQRYMVKEGILRSSISRGYVLHDQLIFGINKG